jgi:hypothetical protein
VVAVSCINMSFQLRCLQHETNLRTEAGGFAYWVISRRPSVIRELAVTHLVKALRHKPEGRGFDFFFDLIRLPYGYGVDLAS